MLEALHELVYHGLVCSRTWCLIPCCHDETDY